LFLRGGAISFAPFFWPSTLSVEVAASVAIARQDMALQEAGRRLAGFG